MAVNEAAEEEGEGQEDISAGDEAAEEEGKSTKGQASAASAPEEARLPRTKKAPVGMIQAEWQIHRLTHLPYNPACRCWVAGKKKRDDQHRRREVSQAALDAEGASICAD